MHFRMKPAAVPILAVALFSTSIVAAQKHKTPPPPPPAHPGKVAAPKAPPATHARDFEDVRRELDRAEADLEKALRNIPEPPQPPAPPQIDEAEIERAIKKADAQIASVDMAAVRKDLERARKDMVQARKEMERSKLHQEQAMAQMQEEMKTIRPRIEAQMKEAQEGMEKARKDLDAYEAFVNTLAADGLLNKAAYTIEHRNGKLIIDGKEQPEAVYNKHRAFLQNKEGIRIRKNEQGLNIQKD